jgi:hypothetical protein
MTRIFSIYIGVLLLMLLTLISGCYYDKIEPEPVEPLPTNVSLKSQLVPLFKTNCAASGCHDAEGSHDPSLVENKAYNALLLGNFVNVQNPENSVLYIQVKTDNMPPDKPLSTKEKNLILVWIKEGARDN